MEGNIVFFGCLCFTQHCKWGSVNGWLPPIFGLWLPIFIMSLSLWTVAFQRIFFNCYHFLEILLNDLELVFLKFKHFYKIHRKSLFSFICLFFTRCFIIFLCINTLHLFILSYFSTTCKHTWWVCSLLAYCFIITLYISALHLLYFLQHH